MTKRFLGPDLIKKKKTCSDSEASGLDWQQLMVDSRGSYYSMEFFTRLHSVYFIAMSGKEWTLPK